MIFFARYEASQVGSAYIETEHVLLGILREDKNLTAHFLKPPQVESIRPQIEKLVERKTPFSTGIDLPLTNETKRVLACAAEEAERMEDRHIGTEHLLLGLLREKDSLGAKLPQLYATFLLWMLSELFERLPGVGDPEKPKLVFFFDEAHLLFNDLPQPLQGKMEQVVRLIRSKGVGIYFVTQNPTDIPEVILGQLGNRVQHALRAFTPKDQKAVRAAAQTFRSNPRLNVETTIMELGVGEALVSFLDEKGIPGMVERALVCPPHSQIGPITPDLRQQMIHSDVIFGTYEQAVDRESAYERLKGRNAAIPATQTGQQPSQPWYANLPSLGTGGGRRSDTVVDAMMKSAARSIGSSVGRQIIRGVLGSMLGGNRR